MTIANNFVLDSANLNLGLTTGTTLSLTGTISDGFAAGALTVNATGSTLVLSGANVTAPGRSSTAARCGWSTARLWASAY